MNRSNDAAGDLTDPARSIPRKRHNRHRLAEARGLEELATLRRELLVELKRLASDPDYLRGQAPEACCTRQLNQMRISPLEARAIALAFRHDRRLRERLPEVLSRLRNELRFLRDNGERQHFDCPLLQDGKCLVHQDAKPIGCLAWHPANPAAGDDSIGEESAGERSAGDESTSGHFTELGWAAFETRDLLNDQVFGDGWKARVIPLWLRRIFEEELARAGSGLITLEIIQPPRSHRPSRGPAKTGRPRRPKKK